MEILPFTDAKEIMELGFEEAFEYLTQLTMTGEKKTIKTYYRVRFGETPEGQTAKNAIPFDIYDVFAQGNNYKEKLKNKKITIGDTTANLRDFYTEMEKRRIECKEELIKNIMTPKAYNRR